MKSFHDKIKEKMTVDTKPDLTNGIVINRKVWVLVQPSRNALSSISVGIASKKPRIIHTVNARIKVIWVKTIERKLLSRPNCAKIT